MKGQSRNCTKTNKTDLDNAINQLIQDPFLGKQKKGNLSYLRVHKFKMAKQPVLLGYSYEDETLVLKLIALGSHQNFYRDVRDV